MNFNKKNIITLIISYVLIMAITWTTCNYLNNQYEEEYRALNFYGKVDSIYMGQKDGMNILMNGKWFYIIDHWHNCNDAWDRIQDHVQKNDTIMKQANDYSFYFKKPNQTKFTRFCFSHAK